MKIRSSALGKIMTNPRSKKETLSAGCKTYIKELSKRRFIWIQVYNR